MNKKELNYVELYKKAEQYYNKYQYKRALKIFMDIVDFYLPYDCQDYIGRCYMWMKKFDMAIECYKNLISKDPQWDVSHYFLGKTYFHKGDRVNGLVHFRKAIKINPDNYKALDYIGLYYYLQHSYKIATRYLLKSLKANYDNSYAHCLLSECYYDLIQYDLAMNEIAIALKIDPCYSNAFHIRGLIYRAKGEYQLALESFISAYNINPKDTMYLESIVGCYGKIRNFQEALYWNEKIIELKPNYKKAQKMAEKLNELVHKI